MATINKPEPRSGFDIKTVCPSGQYTAVCLQVEDLFGVQRRKFQSEEMETKDITRFLFGIVDEAGTPYLVQTYEFAISGAPGSNLIKFLTAWLGRAPDYGWDYCELEGTGALLSVDNVQSKGTPPVLYAKITGVFPLPANMAGTIPDRSLFGGILAEATAFKGASPVDPPGMPGKLLQATPAPAPPAPAQAQEKAPPAPEQWPPHGWEPHPTSDGFYFKGQEVLSEDELRGRANNPGAEVADPF